MNDREGDVDGQRETALAERPGRDFLPSGKDAVALASALAQPLNDLIEKKHLYREIGTKEKHKHVVIEGWTTLLAMLGVYPRIVSTRTLDRENEIACAATVELVGLASGRVLSAADGFCSDRESHWRGSEEFAIRSMAQTRALGKAARVAFSWIMVLAGYDATPFEEVDGSKRESEPRGERAPASAPPNAGSRGDAGSRGGGEPRGNGGNLKSMRAAAWARFGKLHMKDDAAREFSARVTGKASSKEWTVEDARKVHAALDEQERKAASAPAQDSKDVKAEGGGAAPSGAPPHQEAGPAPSADAVRAGDVDRESGADRESHDDGGSGAAREPGDDENGEESPESRVEAIAEARAIIAERDWGEKETVRAKFRDATGLIKDLSDPQVAELLAYVREHARRQRAGRT